MRHFEEIMLMVARWSRRPMAALDTLSQLAGRGHNTNQLPAHWGHNTTIPQYHPNQPPIQPQYHKTNPQYHNTAQQPLCNFGAKCFLQRAFLPIWATLSMGNLAIWAKTEPSFSQYGPLPTPSNVGPLPSRPLWPT